MHLQAWKSPFENIWLAGGVSADPMLCGHARDRFSTAADPASDLGGVEALLLCKYPDVADLSLPHIRGRVQRGDVGMLAGRRARNCVDARRGSMPTATAHGRQERASFWTLAPGLPAFCARYLGRGLDLAGPAEPPRAPQWAWTFVFVIENLGDQPQDSTENSTNFLVSALTLNPLVLAKRNKRFQVADRC